MQGIEFQIINDSDEAAKGLERLERALSNLKINVKEGSSSLSQIGNGISKLRQSLKDIDPTGIGDKLKSLSTAVNNLKIDRSATISSSLPKNITALNKAALAADPAKITSIGTSLQTIADVGNSAKISAALPKNLEDLSVALSYIDPSAASILRDIGDGLKPLSELGTAHLTSYINQLGKFPKLIEDLGKLDIAKFSDEMRDLADALKPFADEMAKVSSGFAAFPSRIQRLITSTEQYNGTVKRATSNTNSFGSALKKVSLAVVIKSVGSLIGKAMEKASQYQEVLNLFTVSMGEYAKEAYEYAQTVSDAMGIDPAEWMENQGVFNTIITGFGVAGDKAAYMSKNLTQLSYDLASFYNIGFTEAMQKVQSGIAGELEPMRRLGYDLSVARLEQERLNLGIEKSVSDMTQAEKSQLRYYAMMTQVTQVQGDMARTLNQPANMLRILRAELEQTARAFGNIFIPIMTNTLPWLIAVAQGIREIVVELARLFNIEIGEVDWGSSFSTAAGATGEIEDNMSGAAGAAKDLKRYLAGFDELNVLPDKTSGGSGGGVSAGGGGLDIPLLGYDFLGEEINKKVSAIKKKLAPFINWVKKNIKEITVAVAGIITISALTKLFSKAKSLWQGFLGLGIVKTFLQGFDSVKSAGGGVFKSLKSGIGSVRDGLSGIQKASIVAISGLLEFVTIKNSVKELALGCDDVGAKIATIGVAAAGAAAAMYVALGPAGLAVAAVVGLTAAIVGVSAAQDEMMTKMSNEAFYSGTGAKISDITTRYVGLMNAIVDTNQPIIDHQETIHGLKSSIEETAGSIGDIAHAIELGTVTAAEKVPELSAKFAELSSDTRTYMDEVYDNVIRAVSGSLGDALTKAGIYIPEFVDMMNQIRNEGIDTLNSLNAEMDTLNEQFKNGEISAGEYTTKFMDVTDRMNSLTGATSETAGVFDDLRASMTDISWDDEGQRDDFFAQISESASGAKQSITDTFDSLKENLEWAIAHTDNASFKEMLQKVLTISETDRQTQLASVDEQLGSLYDSIQVDLINKSQKVQDEAAKKWEKMNFLEKAFNGSTAANYTSRALNDYQTNIVNPINKKIQESMNEIGTGGTAWAGDAMTNILNGLFDTRIINNPQGAFGSANSVFKSDLGTEIQRVLKETGKTGEANARNSGKQIISGLGAGITDNLKIGTWAARNAILSMDSAVRDAAKIHSPSKLFAEDGKYMMEGIAEGFKNKTAYVSKIVTDSVTSLFDNSTGYSTGYSFGQSLANGISQAIKNATYPSLKGTMSTYGGTARMSFSAYASGGFPDPGQFFLARENGVPEMVGSIGRRTAVANNDQIVEAVKAGVYEAVVAATGGENNRSGGQAQVVSANVNGKNLFEFVVDYARGETVRTGANPLLEF